MRGQHRAALLLTAVAAMTGLTTTAAHSAPQATHADTTAAEPCGFYVNYQEFQAYYRHCADSSVEIRIERPHVADELRCVGPWSNTRLGFYLDVKNATYNGRTCGPTVSLTRGG